MAGIPVQELTDPQAGRVDAVPSRRVGGREPGTGQVLPTGDMPRVREAVRQPGGSKQPGNVVAHAAYGRDRREVRGALHPPPSRRRAPDRGQRERGEQQDQSCPEQRRERLPASSTIRSATAVTESEEPPRDPARGDRESAAGPRSGERPAGRERSRLSGGDPCRQAAELQLADGQGGQRALRRKGDEQAAAGDGKV
jgi:hypothetical protein